MLNFTFSKRRFEGKKKKSVASRDTLIYCGEDLSALRPTPKLEDRPLSVVRNCSFNSHSYFQSMETLVCPQPEDAPCRDKVHIVMMVMTEEIIVYHNEWGMEV
jgi:hypothetical protein